MKKVIGIIDPGWVEYTDTSDLLKGRGGSETWTVQLSAKFQERGYHVIIFCRTPEWHFNAQGVEWVPINLMESRMQYQKFDHIIISRKIGSNLDIIDSTECCNSVWIQAHDVWISSEENNDPVDMGEIWKGYPFIKGVICLTESHRKWLVERNDLDPDFIKMTGNGLVFEPFHEFDFDQERSHNLFWSSRPERGLDLMIQEILPRIRKVYPDARLRVASYDNIPIDREYDYVDFLGKLTKHQLYEEMFNCRVWCYPAVFPETFCITALENIMCGCIPVVPHRDGMVTTFGPFDEMMLPDQKFETPENYNLVAHTVIKYMEEFHTESAFQLRVAMANHVERNYSWDNIVDKFERIWTCTSIV